jgi:SAM-dependent methyltransferase
MHDSVMKFLGHHIRRDEISGKRVLEIGSLNINGSPREIIMDYGPAVYLGLDEQRGPGVDICMSADYLYTLITPESFDFVVSTETLEHAENWRQTINQIKYVLRPGGIVIITCRAPGYKYHEQPHDHWRFTLDDFRSIFSDMDMRHIQADPEIPGVMAKYQKRRPVDLEQIQPAPAPKE